MASEELGKVYEPAETEKRWYSTWEAAGYFHADANDPRPAYTIVIPPPNVTGSLHMGHALDNTLQDILVRYKRMDGFATLWLPGTDHAGIATQNVVERELQKENLTRLEIGREKFVERVWQWKKESGGKIVHQLRRLGASCDWTRERFTLDEGLSRAVRKVFVSLYSQGLIYRSNYLISWCPRCRTALSDLEVDHEDVDGNLTFFHYLTTEGERITVATTRPETMLGDTAIAVHPNDPRYSKFVGKFVQHPFLDRTFPVIADDVVDPKFGTGAVKVTPAHDPADYAMGERHKLKFITILDVDGKVNAEGGVYAGTDRFEARKKVVMELKAQGLWEKTQPYRHAVGHCQRCKTIVEPRVSEQWFVKIAPLAKPAIEAVKEGRTRFVPDNWTKVYIDWMENIRDWCISRQLWWGHQIPVWYCGDCNERTVTVDDPEACASCGSKALTQDPDVLDTWFSSGLWPFSTLGWPAPTQDLKKFYPTSVLVTGFDIIFFWVARMMMMGMKFMNDVPFGVVHIHALVRDEKGQKMSKSKGNVIDPLMIMDKYGTDAFRFALTSFAIQGRDIPVSEKRIEGYRNFISKIWNATRFALGVLGDAELPASPLPPVTMPDRWIRTRLNEVTKSVRRSIDDMKFNEAADALYHFFWHEVCDWYLELIKPTASDPVTRSTLVYVLERTLRLLHPITPFITEELWQRLPMKKKKPSIMLCEYPKDDGFHAAPSVEEFETVKQAVDAIRTIRSENKISPSVKIEASIRAGDLGPKALERLSHHTAHVQTLAGLSRLTMGVKEIPKNSAMAVLRTMEIYVPLDGLVDFGAEKERIEKERIKAARDVEFLEKRLSDEKYRKNAPAELIARDDAKLVDARTKLEEIERSLQLLKN